MSFTERSAWIRLASIVVVFVPYFRYVTELLQRDVLVGRAICVAFVVAALAHGLLNGIGETVLVFVFGKARRDERDAAIDALAVRVAYFAAIAVVLGGLSTIAFPGTIANPSATGAILLPNFAATSQFVFFGIVAAEALRHATQVFCYRREAIG